ncbi:D-methionine-binding lipoprotein MetQ [invertebrate metagenome]|uniref:D-methionine-binding lipoprotein MetQ n=1 Tax=invertebrate metagenome TaxID=1711999 RepID=A0A2H9T9G4_9ZZZZ
MMSFIMNKWVRKCRGVTGCYFLWIIVSVLGAVVLSGCDRRNVSTPEEDNALKIGVIAGAEADLMYTAIQVLEQEYGVKAEIVEFSDYISPNIALADGSIDVNAFQHGPYLDSVVADRDYPLEPVAKTFLFPMGAYTRKINSLDELPERAKVAIPNDPTNEGRALLLLQSHGIIQLKNSERLKVTPADILVNRKKLRFIELDAAQLPRVLDDVDLAFINSTYAVQAGLLPSRNALIIEDNHSPYVNLLVARKGWSSDDRILKLVKAYQSKNVEQKAESLFRGSAIVGWKVVNEE